MPSSVGSGITEPSSAPARVAAFHVTKRLSSAPSRNGNDRSARAVTTPKASSVRKYAVTTRRQPDRGVARVSDIP
jgi:hypothetical protein